jgi:hypothetical protein
MSDANVGVALEDVDGNFTISLDEWRYYVAMQG